MKLTLQKFACILLFAFISLFAPAQKFHLVKDINALTNSYPYNDVYQNNGYDSINYTVLNNVAYFYATDGVHGYELWRSDGTNTGTYMVKDINPGLNSSNPRQIIVFKNQLFFTADDGVHGTELWKSDGTGSGTNLAVDIRPGLYSGGPGEMISYNGYLYFHASNNGNPQFWKSDGTIAGTVLLKDFLDSARLLYYPVLLQHNIYFFSNDNFGDVQLWKVNNNSNDKVIKIASIPDAYKGGNIASSDNVIYFDLQGDNDYGLWKSDGTTAGTNEIYSSYSYLLGDFVIFKNNLFFNDGSTIYTSDGTSTGTKIIFNTQTSSSNKIVLGTNLYFLSSTSFGSFTLWKRSGINANNIVVKTFDTGHYFSNVLRTTSSYLYFAETTAPDSVGLWKSDGSKTGTVNFKNLARSIYAQPNNYTALKNKILFAGNDNEHGQELWSLDSITNQTNLLKDINTATSESSTPGNLTVFKNEIYFSAETNLYGRELWKSDGTNNGTGLVKDIYPHFLSGITTYNYSAPFFNAGDKLYFKAYTDFYGSELWKTLGDSSKTSLIDDVSAGFNNTQIGFFSGNPLLAAKVNNRFYYTGYTDNSNITILYSTNGLPGSTTAIKQISTFVNPFKSLTPFGNKLAFTINNDQLNQLWITDSTAQTAKQITTAYPSGSNGLMAYNDKLYYAYQNNMWKTDGTDANNRLFKKINPYSYNYFSFEDGTIQISHAVLNNILYFAASNAAYGIELWKTDGSATGTTLVKDINLGTNGSYLSSFVVVDSLIYFLADDGIHGTELWKTNGTTSGTAMVKNVTAGNTSLEISNLSQIEHRVVFLLYNTENHSYSLWKSDGTLDGTKAVTDTSFNNIQITPPLRVIGNKIFFTATSAAYGSELWVGTLDGSFTPQQISFNGNLLNNTDAKLNWSTLNEQNLNKYNLQRSTDGIHFTTIKNEIATADNSLHKNYQYLDNNINQLNSNKIYYRLESIDEDGNSLVSNTVAFQLKNNIKLVVQPNPVSSNFSLQVNGIEADQNLHVEIFNISGTKINDQTKMVRKGNADFNYNTALWSAGTYIARVTFADGTKQEVKITKQ